MLCVSQCSINIPLKYPHFYTDSPPAGQKDPDSVPTIKKLDNLAKEIPTCWKSLGIQLGVDESKIDSISLSIQHIEPDHKAIEMLKEWRNKGGRYATYGKLAEALKHVGMGRLAEKYCRPDKNKCHVTVS